MAAVEVIVPPLVSALLLLTVTAGSALASVIVPPELTVTSPALPLSACAVVTGPVVLPVTVSGSASAGWG